MPDEPAARGDVEVLAEDELAELVLESQLALWIRDRVAELAPEDHSGRNRVLPPVRIARPAQIGPGEPSTR